jgi:hypothetical protein
MKARLKFERHPFTNVPEVLGMGGAGCGNQIGEVWLIRK